MTDINLDTEYTDAWGYPIAVGVHREFLADKNRASASSPVSMTAGSSSGSTHG